MICYILIYCPSIFISYSLSLSLSLFLSLADNCFFPIAWQHLSLFAYFPPFPLIVLLLLLVNRNCTLQASVQHFFSFHSVLHCISTLKPFAASLWFVFLLPPFLLPSPNCIYFVLFYFIDIAPDVFTPFIILPLFLSECFCFCFCSEHTQIWEIAKRRNRLSVCFVLLRTSRLCHLLFLYQKNGRIISHIHFPGYLHLSLCSFV